MSLESLLLSNALLGNAHAASVLNAASTNQIRICDSFDYPPMGLSASVRALPEWIQAGCGEKDYYCEEKGAMFLYDNMPDELDLENHNSYFADVIKANPELYKNLKDKKTSSGVTLANCIKTGVDNKGHPHIKTVGMVAGDEESYEIFKDLFDPVVSARHNGYK